MNQTRKQASRRDLRQWLAEMADEQYQFKSTLACQHLQSVQEFQNSTVVMMFLSLAREILTAGAIAAALEQGKGVAVPKVNWHDHSIIPVALTSLEAEMESDRYGLRHPVRAEQMPAERIDLVVVPGLGFDQQGNRLGHGGGFYDRFLSANGCTWTTCGLAFEEQVMEEVPVEEHDVNLDMLVTDAGIRRFDT